MGNKSHLIVLLMVLIGIDCFQHVTQIRILDHVKNATITLLQNGLDGQTSSPTAALPFTDLETLSLQAKVENRILIYITTHLTEMHSTLLERCWPTLITKSPLFQQADCMLFITEQEDAKVNMTLIKSVFAHKEISVHVRPNPGYHEGAILAFTEGLQNHWFDAYEWVIRVNADTLIRNDTFLLERMKDNKTHGIFDDCWEVPCPNGSSCKGRFIHTDFFAIRPNVLSTKAIEEAYQRHKADAERMVTDAFSSIINAGADSWLPGTGPHYRSCRVVGDSSPVLHTHQIDEVYPACLFWYD